MTAIPRLTSDQLKRMTGGALVVRYMECARRHARMPDARWLEQRTREAGDELLRRHQLGMLSDTLCGLLSHVYDGPWGSANCTCEAPSVEEGGWGQPEPTEWAPSRS